MKLALVLVLSTCFVSSLAEISLANLNSMGLTEFREVVFRKAPSEYSPAVELFKFEAVCEFYYFNFEKKFT